MSAVLTVIWWRDIPAQVIAKDRRVSHKIVLHARFQTAIDRAAQKAGLKEWNAYLEQWRKEQRICGDDVQAEAEAEAERLEATYTKDVLARIADSGGLDDPDAPRARPGHLPPSDDDAGDDEADGSDGTDSPDGAHAVASPDTAAAPDAPEPADVP
jgi:hypothetical protein